MKQYTYQNATIKIHGSVDREKLIAATTKFLKKAQQAKKASKKPCESSTPEKNNL